MTPPLNWRKLPTLSLAGIDTIETDTVDQPQPNDDLENDSTINDVMTMLQDKQADDPDSQGTLNL